MREASHLYRHLDEWARNLSRLRNATFVCGVSCSSYLLASAVFGEVKISGAVTIGFTLTVLFFTFDPNRSDRGGASRYRRHSG
jgi:hypothetical protein